MVDFPSDPDERWRVMSTMDGETIVFTVEREMIEPGRTFSADAMDALVQLTTAWIGTRVMRRWAATSEPPSAVTVTVTVEVH